MYHYVREGAAVPARTTGEFERQLDHFAREYTVVGCADVLAGRLPDDACLLTFDDGLVEHAEYVAPALERRGFTGCFCPAGRSTLERRPLDAQKTQFLLAASRDHTALGRRVLDLVAAARTEFDLPTEAELRRRNTPAHAYDRPETVLVKRLLQDGLPDPLRSRILDELFADLVDDDEGAFAERVYLTLDDLRSLRRSGMTVAAHGYEHRRLGLLDEEAQQLEIARSRELLAAIAGEEPSGWAFCYPYGSRDSTSARLLAEAGCALAFTTDPRRVAPDDDLLELPRLDTNDVEAELAQGAQYAAADVGGPGTGSPAGSAR
jgi:peptidoglycan/xylan/chitin deacetylase (PgdA/CDA1 family)